MASLGARAFDHGSLRVVSRRSSVMAFASLCEPLPPRTRPFVGLSNYLSALGDPVFWHSLSNSVLWVFGSVSMQFLLGLGGALLLNRSFAWRGLARALVIVPWALRA
jgi:ABC-type sugar transport system permease subunit